MTIHKFEFTADIEPEEAGDLLLDFRELVEADDGKLLSAFIQQEKQEEQTA